MMRPEIFDATITDVTDRAVVVRLESWDADDSQIVRYDPAEFMLAIGGEHTKKGTRFHCHAASVRGVLRIVFGLPDGTLVVNDKVVFRFVPLKQSKPAIDPFEGH